MSSLIQEEVRVNRVDGPFQQVPFKKFRCSPSFVVPKKELGAFRLILNLSYPKGEGLNAYVDPMYTSVNYQDVSKPPFPHISRR